MQPDDFERLMRDDIKLELTEQAFEGGIKAMAEATMDEARIDRLLTERKRQFEIEDPSQWSRFETVPTRWALADACARIEHAFARYGWPIETYPAVGTLTTGQVGATTQRAPGGAPLIVLDNAFLRFSGTLAQLAVQAGLEQAHGIPFTLPTLQLLSDLVATHVVIGTCLYLNRRTIDPSIRALVDARQDAIFVYVIAHEYGHISVGDLDAPAGASRRGLEFQADAYGVLTALDTTHAAVSPVDGLYGAFLYLAGLDIMERAAAIYAGRPRPPKRDKVYPRPSERAKELRTQLGKLKRLGPFKAEIRDAARCYELLLEVWGVIEPAFAACRGRLAAYEGTEGGLESDYASSAATMLLWQAVTERRSGR